MPATIVSIIQILCACVLIVFVLGQSGKHSGLGTIGGATDSFLSKNKAKSAGLHGPDPGPVIPVSTRP